MKIQIVLSAALIAAASPAHADFWKGFARGAVTQANKNMEEKSRRDWFSQCVKDYGYETCHAEALRLEQEQNHQKQMQQYEAQTRELEYQRRKYEFQQQQLQNLQSEVEQLRMEQNQLRDTR